MGLAKLTGHKKYFTLLRTGLIKRTPNCTTLIVEKERQRRRSLSGCDLGASVYIHKLHRSELSWHAMTSLNEVTFQYNSCQIRSVGKRQRQYVGNQTQQLTNSTTNGDRVSRMQVRQCRQRRKAQFCTGIEMSMPRSRVTPKRVY